MATIRSAGSSRRSVLAAALGVGTALAVTRVNGRGAEALAQNLKIDEFNNGERTTGLGSNTSGPVLEIVNRGKGSGIDVDADIALDAQGDVEIDGAVRISEANPGPLVDIRNRQAGGQANGVRAAIGNAPVVNQGAAVLGVSSKTNYPALLGFSGIASGTGVKGEAAIAGEGVGVHGIASAETGSDTGVRAEAKAPSATALDVIGKAQFSAGATFAGRVVAGSLEGDGSGVEGLSAANLTGTVGDARLTPNIPRLDAGSNAFAGAVTATRFGGADVAAPSFANSGVFAIPKGKLSFNVLTPLASADSTVLVTLQSDPGPDVLVRHVFPKAGKFGVYLTKPATKAARLAYFVIAPA